MNKLMKVLTGSLILVWVLGGNAASTYASHIEVKDHVQAKVLDWGTFTTKADGKKLNCDEYKSDVDSVLANPDAYSNFEKDAERTTAVKGCVMERMVDRYATWFIFLWIACLVGYLIFLGVKMSIQSSDGGGGWMPGGGWDGWFGAFKTPLIWLWVLVFVLIGWLNILVNFFKFILDIFLR